MAGVIVQILVMHMLFKGMVDTTLCDLPGVIGHRVKPKVYTSALYNLFVWELILSMPRSVMIDHVYLNTKNMLHAYLLRVLLQ